MRVHFDQMSDEVLINWVRTTQGLDLILFKGFRDLAHHKIADNLSRHAIEGTQLYDGGRHVRARFSR